MIRFTLIPILLLVLPVYSLAQDNPFFPCAHIQQASENADQIVLQTEWIQSEIHSDSLMQWADNWLEENVYLDDPALDSIQKPLYNEFRLHINNTFTSIRNSLQIDDRIFYYSTPDNYWNALVGEDGLVVVRNCNVINKHVLTRN